MKYPIPRPLNKTELKRDIAKYEKKFKEPNLTLSQAVNDPSFIQAWDIAGLTASELTVIYDSLHKNHSASAILIQLKKL